MGVTRLLGLVAVLGAAGACLARTKGKGYASGGYVGNPFAGEDCMGCGMARVQVEQGQEHSEQCRVCGCLWVSKPRSTSCSPTPLPPSSSSSC